MKLTELANLFDITYGNKLDLNKMKVVAANNDYAVAFVSRTREKNGIVAYVERIADIVPYEAGCLTVALGGSVLSTFTQYDNFYTGQNVAVLIPKEAMSEQVKAYYCMAVKKNMFRYSTCGREANKTLRKLLVPEIPSLPEWVEKSKFPDYSHIKKSINNAKYRLDVTAWKKFKYTDLFEIKKGKRVTRFDMISGSTPFVSAIDKNNGIRELTGLVGMHKGNTITVNYNGSVGEAFYQEVPFWASDDVNILYPKFELNKYIAIFIITIIKKEKYRFNYGRKWHKERMEECEMLLPIDAKGELDYNFMETYIKSLKYSSCI